MFEYHVTYGASKKIIKTDSNVAKDIFGPIRKGFSLDPNCSLHLQYWHKKYDDWVDCEELDEISEDSKLNVFQNVFDIPLDSSSMPKSPSSNAEIRCSTPFSSLTSSIIIDDPVNETFDQQTSRQKDREEFPYLYKLPNFPPWCQTMLEERSPLCKESKCRRAIIDVLFDDLLCYGHYPTSRMFQETSRALVEAHPILKDRHFVNAQPHDSWVLRLRDKFKKFRSRHAELCNAEEVERMKAKFGTKRETNSCKGQNSLDNSLTSVKRVKVQELSEIEEDQFSINIHLKVLQEECRKRQPNDDLIQDKMVRTFSHRISYITTHSVAETLTCFPPLKQTNELLNEGMRLGIAEAVLKEFLHQKKTNLLILAQNRKQKNVKVSQLLTAQAECACTEDSELAFLALLLPCLMKDNLPVMYAEENAEVSVVKPVIVYRHSTNVFLNSCYEIYLDTINVTKAEDLVTAITLWFTLFWVFDVGYTKDNIKVLAFFDKFIFKKCSLKEVPRSVTSFFNAI